MAEQIRVGIVGYGNLGRGVELAITQNKDIRLVGVFTRRDPSKVKTVSPDTKVYRVDDALQMQREIDVMILCGGSATDLANQGPQFAAHFHTVDSFDTHAKIPEYFASMDEIAKKAQKVAAISIGWDPGLFSINRLIGEAALPDGATYTFWGKGVSQGHSDAIRRVPGVQDAIQYTIPIQSAVDKVRSGVRPELTVREKHLRECYVVAEPGADQAKIQKEIEQMPNYFADYDTVVHFVSEEELKKNHSAMPHGGVVIRSGVTGVCGGTNQVVEFSLNLQSNPEFTSSVLVAYARAVYRLAQEKCYGAKTVLDIAPSYLSPKSVEQLRKELL